MDIFECKVKMPKEGVEDVSSLTRSMQVQAQDMKYVSARHDNSVRSVGERGYPSGGKGYRKTAPNAPKI